MPIIEEVMSRVNTDNVNMVRAFICIPIVLVKRHIVKMRFLLVIVALFVMVCGIHGQFKRGQGEANPPFPCPSDSVCNDYCKNDLGSKGGHCYGKICVCNFIEPKN